MVGDSRQGHTTSSSSPPIHCAPFLIYARTSLKPTPASPVYVSHSLYFFLLFAYGWTPFGASRQSQSSPSLWTRKKGWPPPNGHAEGGFHKNPAPVLPKKDKKIPTLPSETQTTASAGEDSPSVSKIALQLSQWALRKEESSNSSKVNDYKSPEQQQHLNNIYSQTPYQPKDATRKRSTESHSELESKGLSPEPSTYWMRKPAKKSSKDPPIPAPTTKEEEKEDKEKLSVLEKDKKQNEKKTKNSKDDEAAAVRSKMKVGIRATLDLSSERYIYYLTSWVNLYFSVSFLDGL